MIKKIKCYLRKRKIQKEIQCEVLETLASICLYLDYESHFSHNPKGRYMRSHFEGLKHYSTILRKEILGENDDRS